VSHIPNERHILLGVSYASNDPSRHRTFEVRAVFDAERGGWIARYGEKSLNDQIERWVSWPLDDGRPRVFPTAADCLGQTATSVIAMVERDDDGVA
jgi:hypothetical protein